MKSKKNSSKFRPELPENIAVSLSGGGHRATLFGLGVLLALVDRRLNKRVKQIASVSGGSITNAFIAYQINYNDSSTTSEVFDNIAAKLIEKIVKKGVLTWSVIAILLAILIVPPILFFVLAIFKIIPWSLAIPAIIIWLFMALMRGLFIEWVLELRYFPPKLKFALYPPTLKIERRRLKDIDTNTIEHALCCTDLIKPGPTYFSSQAISKNHKPGIFVSLSDKVGPLKRCASYIPIASAVRSSAGFPAVFPPRLTHFNTSEADFANKNMFGSEVFNSTPYLKKKYLLSDGGIWNNLGSQVLREIDSDSFRYGEMTLITADASVALSKQNSFPLRFPGVSLVKSILRITNIQHESTVLPRLERMRNLRYDLFFGSVKSIREKSRFEALIKELKLDSEQMDIFTDLNDFGYLYPSEKWDIPICLRDSPGYPLSVIIDQKRNISKSIYQEYGALQETYDASSELLKLTNIDISSVGTHLNRISEDLALGILARAYLSTFVWSAVFKPIQLDEVKQLENVPNRLKKMVLSD